MVSFDMSSLFTNVPIGEAVQVIQAKLREDDSLAERTPLSPDRVAELLLLQVNYREGATAVVANLYMKFFEELALESAPSWPRLWKQYVVLHP